MRSYGPGRPLVLSHIPKTAGTSLGAALNGLLQPDVSVLGGIDTSLWGGYDDVSALDPVLRPGIYLTPEELPADASLVAAHLAPATTMERYPRAEHLTVLRSPQVRVLSQWMHSRSLSDFTLRRWGPSANAFRAGRRPLREYLDEPMIAPSVDNTITRFLAWPHPALQRTGFIAEKDDDALVDAALTRLDRFAHVNLVENPKFMADIAEWLGGPLDSPQLNERTSVLPAYRTDLATELDADTRGHLDHRCRLDLRVWRHVAARVLPDADHDSVLATALARAVDRYTELMSRPYDASLVRRVVERAYDVKVRLTRGAGRG